MLEPAGNSWSPPPGPALLPLDSLVARLDLGAWADGSNLTRGAPAYVWAYASGDSASWPVCPPGWDDAAADLVCRLNGLGNGRAVDAHALPNPTRIPIGYPFPKDKIGLVECSPGASSLADCRGAFIRKGDCKAIAMVSCSAPARPPPGGGPAYGGGSSGGPPAYGYYGGGPPRGRER
ncbi:hypothetical protein HYH03_005511 [Edaphochlamys debaryana]|uniref:SRCR domain-containing protein n=1 Tax=Edaphochlamys debaryana TaxID=47281 RepID=A0A835Y5C2_9CHLO|nr:hypothetical protein HYH03_005511 [Edaphochlamys debaryana]|eukprot:KAG2496278.1 hypothetical protein HYH03_005511 [Edaphochlamys debaryana]